MPVPDWVETVLAVGVPTIVGTLVGGLIGHYSARARGREDYQRARDLLVEQDERRTARAMHSAARDIRARLHAEESHDFVSLRKEWEKRIVVPATEIRDDELRERADAVNYVLFLACRADPVEAELPVMLGVDDVTEWLHAWLLHKQPPAADLPKIEDIKPLIRASDRRVTLSRLNDVLENR